MHLNLTHITKNPIVLVSVILSLVGWFISFIGSCILGRAAGVFWWIIIYELLVVGGIFFSIFKQVFHQYQVMFLIFLGISIALLTTAIDELLNVYTGGAQAAGAGAVILIVMQFFWVILFGSTEESAVYQFIYSQSGPVSQTNNHGNIQGSPKESKVALSSPEATSQYSQNHQSVASIPVMQQQPIAQQQAQPEQIMATALHPYQANPDDPNELSFAKEEVLEILNKSGNWWQAKKQDGTIGIVPSNYFAQ